jgi:hypothetical protein
MSEELGKILKDAKHLLCDIEHFVNSTSSQKIGQKDWIKKREMKELVKFENLTAMYLHRTFAKGRFQDYIQKLFKRIEQQSERNYVEKQVTYPKLKSIKRNNNKQQGTKRARKGNKRNQNGRKIDQQNEVAVTKRTHIVRTSKNPAQVRNNKSKNNRRRQRTRTTTTSTTVAL